jgi:hypothetical protein
MNTPGSRIFNCPPLSSCLDKIIQSIYLRVPFTLTLVFPPNSNLPEISQSPIATVFGPTLLFVLVLSTILTPRWKVVLRA